MELWGFKGLKKLEKTNINVHLYKFVFSVKQSTAENFVYGELGRRSCQFRPRWRQVKFWNRLIGLPQRRLAYKALQVAFEYFQQQFIRKLNTKIHQRKLTSCLIGNSQQQIPNYHINSEIKENIYKLFKSCGTNKYWKLQKVTGNSMLRTYESLEIHFLMDCRDVLLLF